MAFNFLMLQEIVNNALIYKGKEVKKIFMKVKFQFRTKKFVHALSVTRPLGIAIGYY